MSKDDLRAKYGRTKKTRQLINAAIRAEQPFGNEILDLLEQVHNKTALGGKQDIVDLVEQVMPHLVAVRNLLEDRVRRDYDMEITQGDHDGR